MRRMTDGLQALALSGVVDLRLTVVAANANANANANGVGVGVGISIGLGLGIPSAAALGTRQTLPTHRAPA